MLRENIEKKESAFYCRFFSSAILIQELALFLIVVTVSFPCILFLFCLLEWEMAPARVRRLWWCKADKTENGKQDLSVLQEALFSSNCAFPYTLWFSLTISNAFFFLIVAFSVIQMHVRINAVCRGRYTLDLLGNVWLKLWMNTSFRLSVLSKAIT